MKIIYRTNKIKENANAFLFGLKGLSTLEKEIDLNELNELNELKDKKIFLSIDKNIFNSDLKYLEQSLKEIDNLNIEGILFYDLAVLSIAKKLNLKTNLIWSQNFLVTNYKTCNFYEKEGVNGALLAPLIPIEDIKEIVNNTKLDIFVPIFGYQMMALSKRHLVSNYFDYIDEENNEEINYMIEKEDKYIIKEEEYGTKIYTKDVLNGIKYINELKKVGVKYIILDNFMIEDEKFDIISSMYERAVNNNLNDEELIEKENEVKKLIPNSSTSFFDKKTVYKVK